MPLEAVGRHEKLSNQQHQNQIHPEENDGALTSSAVQPLTAASKAKYRHGAFTSLMPLQPKALTLEALQMIAVTPIEPEAEINNRESELSDNYWRNTVINKAYGHPKETQTDTTLHPLLRLRVTTFCRTITLIMGITL